MLGSSNNDSSGLNTFTSHVHIISTKNTFVNGHDDLLSMCCSVFRLSLTCMQVSREVHGSAGLAGTVGLTGNEIL